MRRDIFIHFSFLVSLFILLSVFKGWLNLSYWPLWLGGLVGMILPGLDHFIYIFFIGPQELTSQRIIYLLRNKNFIGAARLLLETRMERVNLIFHSTAFKIVASVLAFWIITSSRNILGKGIILGLVLNLLINQAGWYLIFGFIIFLVFAIFAL